MSEATLAFIGMLVTAGISLITTILAILRQSKRDKAEKDKIVAETGGEHADAAASITETAMFLIGPLKKQIASLTSEVNLREQQVLDLRELIEKLETRLEEYEDAVSERDKHISLLENGIRVLIDQIRISGVQPAFVLPRQVRFAVVNKNGGS